jgi:hypothetical protein
MGRLSWLIIQLVEGFMYSDYEISRLTYTGSTVAGGGEGSSMLHCGHGVSGNAFETQCVGRHWKRCEWVFVFAPDISAVADLVDSAQFHLQLSVRSFGLTTMASCLKMNQVEYDLLENI